MTGSSSTVVATRNRRGWAGGVAALGVLLLGPSPAPAQNVPPVFIPFQTLNDQPPLNHRFGDSIRGFFDFNKNFVFQGTFPRINQGFDEFAKEASASIDEVPIPSGSVSVAYTFDPTLETFVRWERPFSPALSLNARTDGRGILTVGAGYSYVDYKNFNGQDRDEIDLPTALVNTANGQAVTDGSGRPAIDVALLQFRLRQNIFTVSMQYGLLDRLDVGVLIPVLKQSFRGRLVDRFFVRNPDGSLQPAVLVVDPNTGRIGARADNSRPPVKNAQSVRLRDFNQFPKQLPFVGFSFADHTDGVGDVVLRSRVFLGSAGPIDFGGGLNISLPTGDEDNLLGVGSVRLDPRLLVSTANARFALHTNQAFHADVDERNRDRYDYSVGGEVLVLPWITVLVDQVGRIDVSGSNKVKKFDIVPGVKINVYENAVVGFNAIVPLNDEGLRTDFTPNGTAEVSMVF